MVKDDHIHTNSGMNQTIMVFVEFDLVIRFNFKLDIYHSRDQINPVDLCERRPYNDHTDREKRETKWHT